jgi:sulfate adenylyltransferase large subunit
MPAAQVQLAHYVGIESFVRQQDEKSLLRFTTAGSVDDGKSTLIGRLLYDCKGAYEDQIASLRRLTVKRSSGDFDLALLTDGLRAEREQGITIDVAYRYFSTAKCKFIIADTPGHEQYTRNMATGASTADLALILIDARQGILPQSRRHAFIASLLGIQHVVAVVNKMDLVDYDESIFTRICSEFANYASSIEISHPHFIPISALHGDNVVEKSARMPWFQGSSLLTHLETVTFTDHNFDQLRFPVQCVIRPHLNFRGYAGQVLSGVIKIGDPIMVLPSGRISRVRSIVTYDGELTQAFAPMSVTVGLQDELDISRGDMLVPPSSPPYVAHELDARIVWLHEQPLEIGRTYLLKHTTHTVRARVDAVQYRIDVNSLQKEPSKTLCLNDIGVVDVSTQQPLCCDSYERSRATGSFILIDPMNNATIAAGMIGGITQMSCLAGKNVINRATAMGNGVTRLEQESRAGHVAITIWIDRDSGDIAHQLERTLFERGHRVHMIGNDPRLHIAELCRVLNNAGVIAIYQSSNDELRTLTRQFIGADRFLIINSDGNSSSSEHAANRVYQFLQKCGLRRGF